MPDNFADFRKQRFRWAYGAVTILRGHYQTLLGLKPSRLTPGQRYHFFAGWLPWLADGFNLLFNFAALAWSVGMVTFPHLFMPPPVSIAAIPLVLFAFKVTKSFLLYRRRIAASLRQSLAAGIAGLALSHTIARAIWTGFFHRGLGFFRTPKLAGASGLVSAIFAVREELLFLIAFCLAVVSVLSRDDAYMLDVRVWAVVLGVQAIPYLATLLVAAAGARQAWPASWVGTMGEIRGRPGRA
jgi:cellulose synthase/poly-beta-1,6-N-acetylglucosamine synthase-like glycosyltransferase